jgi:hypothetical protein
MTKKRCLQKAEEWEEKQEPRFECESCGTQDAKEEYLCKPKKIN